MKISEVVKRLKKTKENENWADIGIFSQDLSIQTPYGEESKFNERVKGYYILSWFCIDTEVGLCAYFMDDEFIALGFQDARESVESLDFVSLDAAKKVKEFILSLGSGDSDRISILDLDEDIEDTFFVHYSSQVQAKEGFYQNKPVKVKGKCWGYNTDPIKGLTMHQIKIEVQDGSEKVIPCEEFKMRINIID